MEDCGYRIEKGKIITEDGLPLGPRWFCDGRVAFSADEEGIADINYFGPDSAGYIAFHRRFWKGMCFYAQNESGLKSIRPKKCEIMPFGFQSHSENVSFSLYTAKDSIYIIIKPEEEFTFRMEFYDEYCFYPESREQKDIRYGGAPREWSPFVFADNKLMVSYASKKKKTNIAFTANTVLSFRRTPRNTKNILSAEKLQAGKEYVIAVNFSNGKNRNYAGYQEIIGEQFARYATVAERAPVLKSRYEWLNNFFELAPMYHESLKTIDVKGAIRAQSTHYWVWGWDSMTSNASCFYWGDHAFIGEMLVCMKKHSHSGPGIAHAFGHNMETNDAAAVPAQGMYITLLDLYRLSGGAVSEHYTFCKKLFEKILDSEAADTGLCKGTSLYPDFRNLIRETGNDISSFNNTVSYCSARSMEKIAASMEDRETEEKAGEFADRMKENFNRILFQEKLGFIDSSVEADTYEHRMVASNNAVKWENNYCDHLVSDVAEKCLEFYEKHLVTRAGLRPLPEESACYDADANQLHCWWPVMSEFYTRLLNRFDRKELMDQYVGWIEYWTKRLMCPEGISCYCNEENVPFDNWNAQPGIWHGYSIRGFYNAAVHSFVGVDFDEEGLHIYPYTGEEVQLENLHFGNRRFDISMKGSGRTVLSVTFNQEVLGSITTIKYPLMKDRNVLEVVRGE